MTGVPARARERRSLVERVERVGGAVMRGLVVLALVYLLLPIVVLVATSFTATDFLVFPPRGLSLRWYATFRSLIASCICVVETSSMAGY